MAIKIGNLNLKKSDKTFVFSDLNYSIFPKKTFTELSIPAKNDINNCHDLDAIKNEIRNILNTPKYTRITNPNFGFDFLNWIGQPISQSFADMQRMNIVNILKNGSDRFKLTGLDLVAMPDQKMYYIRLKITIPYFQGERSIEGFVNGGLVSFL